MLSKLLRIVSSLSSLSCNLCSSWCGISLGRKCDDTCLLSAFCGSISTSWSRQCSSGLMYANQRHMLTITSFCGGCGGNGGAGWLGWMGNRQGKSTG